MAICHSLTDGMQGETRRVEQPVAVFERGEGGNRDRIAFPSLSTKGRDIIRVCIARPHEAL